MVRKRRNSLEKTISPRQTRRGRVRNDEADSGSTAKAKISPRTPSAEARTTRARVRKATKSKALNDSDNEPVPKNPRTAKKKSAEDDPSSQTSRAASGMQKDANVSLESLNSTRETVIEVPATGSKRQDKMKNDSLISEDDLSPIRKRSPAKKSQPTKARAKKSPVKNASRSAKPRVANRSDSLISEDESPGGGSPSRNTARTSDSKNSLISEDGSTLVEESEFEKSLKSASKKQLVDTPRKMTPRKSPKVEAKIFAVAVTPESSPIIVALTPHRSTKTPRKSPKNLGSPKTHAQTPLRLSKTPRKLPVTADSPATSDKSGVSSNRSTPKAQGSAGNTPNAFAGTMTEVKKLSPVPGKSGRTAKLRSPKFSKSPKIVLKSPKPKSPSPRKKLGVPSTKAKKSPVKIGFGRSPKAVKLSPTIIAGSSKSPGSGKSPRSRKMSKTPSPRKSKAPLRNPRLTLTAVETPKRTPLKKASTPASKIKKSPLKTPSSRSPSKLLSPKSTASSPAPKVVRGRVAQPKTPLSKLRTSLKKASLTTPRNSPTKSPSPSLKALRRSAGKKDPALAKSASKLRPELPRGTPKSVRKVLAGSKSPGAPSPRGKIRRSLNLTPDFRAITPDATSSPVNTPRGVARRSSPVSRLVVDGCSTSTFAGIENESDPLMTDSQLMNFSGSNSSLRNSTYEVDKQQAFEDEKTGEENATYELAEPKTPNLRRKARKRSLSVANLDNSDPELKRRCRVRFASPVQLDIAKSVPGSRSVGAKSNALPYMARREKTPGTVGRQSLVGTRRLGEPLGKSLAKDSPSGSLRRRSNSMSNIEIKTPVGKSEINKRSSSVSEASAKASRSSIKAQNSSVNRLSKPKAVLNSEKKSERRTPVARKAPNFALMHQKKFEKMESLVDAKRRVAERHALLNNSISATTSKLASKIPKFSGLASSEKIAPSDTMNGTFNRFGFKLRKNEAKNVMTKKLQPAKTRDQKTRENRTLLKNVRLNKRFELQMKSRNINQ